MALKIVIHYKMRQPRPLHGPENALKSSLKWDRTSCYTAL